MKKFVLVAMLFVSLFVVAQADFTKPAKLPDAPQPKFLTKETVTELTLVGASLAADAMSTEKYLEFNHYTVGCQGNRPCYTVKEPNPLARVFVKNRAGTALYFGGAFALDVYATYLLKKHHHQRIARVMNIAITGWESLLATQNYRSINNSQVEHLLHHQPLPPAEQYTTVSCMGPPATPGNPGGCH